MRGFDAGIVEEKLSMIAEKVAGLLDKPSHETGLPGPFEREQLFNKIQVGDFVTIITPHDSKLKGRAVMRGPAGWVLNLGGAHGTPGIASEDNVIALRKGRSSSEKVASRYRFNALRDDPNSWYNKPVMLGHEWAKWGVDEIERVANKYSASQQQRLIIDKVFNFDVEDWHYFNMMSKKNVANILFVLKNLGSYGALKTLNALQRRSGMWREDIEKILQVMAYDESPEEYVRQNASTYTSYGMKQEDAEARVKNLVSEWRKDMEM